MLALAAAPARRGAEGREEARRAKPTVEEARKFLADASKRLLDLSIEGQRAEWVQETFITYDTQILAAARGEVLLTDGVDGRQGGRPFRRRPAPRRPAPRRWTC